jgi:hypothetical protein
MSHRAIETHEMVILDTPPEASGTANTLPEQPRFKGREG